MRKYLNYIIIFSLLLASHYTLSIELNTNSIGSSPKQISEITPLQDLSSISPRNWIKEKEAFGNQETFWVWDYADERYEQRNATLLAVGEKCYVYMANITINKVGQAAAIAKCNRYKDEFDTTTYDKNVELMGHPDGRLGDIDGDPRVTIFLTPLNPNYGGCYLRDDDPYSLLSNYREMIYVHSEIESDLFASIVMMHEFNHLIFFNYDSDEGYFLTEGIAEYASYYAGYFTNASALEWLGWVSANLSINARDFATDYQTSLLSWHAHRSLFPGSDYGKAYLFTFYLAEQYGNELIKKLVTTDFDGPRGIDAALAETGYDITFNEVFLNWITACAIDNEDYTNGLYGFKNADFTVDPKIIRQWEYPYEKTNEKHYYYGFNVKALVKPPDEFTFKITNSIYALGISIVIRDQNGWNVTHNIHSEKNIVKYISGESISIAYIITSVMYQTTPTSFRNYYRTAEPYFLLNCTIEKGHLPVTTIKTTSETTESITGFTCASVVVFLGIIIILKKSYQGSMKNKKCRLTK
ncbi:MAG: hypothetical protein ACFFCZ_17800 [Promethearchaeota archaeon]